MKQPDANAAALDSLSPEAQSQLAAALDAYMSDLERGQKPDIEALVRQFPLASESLRTYIESLDYLHEATAELHRGDKTPATDADSATRRLGDYAIVREIGRGGMGVVYEAKQISLDRQVALKVLPFAAVLDRRQIARFYNEAQAAAHLHHPNIVPIFSIGCDRGVHFYAMQYIEGQPLDVAIGQLRGKVEVTARPAVADATTEAVECLATTPAASHIGQLFSEGRSSRGEFFREAAKLGIDAAEALEHAHQCGIVHRDVKPGNLLLDERGKVWITDFGLARFSAAEGVTATGDVMGTVRYMSPEQVAGKNSAVDHRTDIYSLGITLYELLTLRPAFEGSDRQEFLRWITVEEPVSPRRIDPAIPFDFETILLKAIAKSPQDRYATAKEMVDDLRRFLDDKPVAARRAGFADRASKWAKRHKTAVALAACLSAVILVGSVVSTLMIASEHARTKAALAEAESNLKKADDNFRRAEKHFRQLREVIDRFGAEHAERLKNLPGAESLRRELLSDTLNYYREFVRFAADDPSLEVDLAVTYSKAAAVIEQIGDKNEALSEYRQAAEVYEKLLAENPNDADHRANLALCRNNCGLLLASLGKSDEAEADYRKALDIQTRLVAEHPAEDRYGNDLALTYCNLGLLENSIDRLAEGEKSFAEAIRLQKQLVEKFPDKAEYLHSLALSYNNLSFLRMKVDLRKAEEASSDTLAIQQRLADRFPQVAEYQRDLALALNNLGALESHNNHLDRAETSYRKAIGIQEQLARKSPSIGQFRGDLAISYNNLGRALSQAERLADAQAAFESAETTLKQLLDDYPDDLAYRSSLAGILNNLGMVAEQQHRPEDAVKYYAQSIEHQRFAFERAGQVVQFRDFLRKHYSNYCRVLRSLDRHAEALEAAEAFLELSKDDAEQLFRLAGELAEAGEKAGLEEKGTGVDSLGERYRNTAVTALEKALDVGLTHPERIASDAAFEPIRRCKRYESLSERLTKTP